MPDLLITINTGSSSIKAAVYDAADVASLVLRVTVDRIGSGEARMLVAFPDGGPVSEDTLWQAGFDSALAAVARAIARRNLGKPVGVGHRVVHGGPRFSAPQVVTPDLLEYLRSLVPLDPQHLPQAIAAIDALSHAFPDAVQVACFDTAFHRDMPRFAQLYGLPYALAEEGVLRYGFHGLSYESIVWQLRAQGILSERMVAAHLGNGCSMAAIRAGRSADTTMGFTPTGGLVMGTRSGDLDPGVAVYLLETRRMDAAGLSTLINRDSGLLGLSGRSSDMRDVLGAAEADQRAREAVDVFCYVARKYLASMVAALDGVDEVVFTGGIGEHSAEIRSRICSGLAFLDIALNDDLNGTDAGIISEEGSITVRVMRTDEDGMIARHTADVMSGKDGEHVRF